MIKFISTLIVIVSAWTLQEFTSIEGKVTDLKGHPLVFGPVALFQNGVLVIEIDTDLDGNFFLAGVKPGTYDMEARYTGYVVQRQTGLIIKAGRTNRVNFQLSVDVCILDLGVEIKAYKVPLIEFDNFTTGITTSGKISKLPTKSVNGSATTRAGISLEDGASIRSLNSSETVYFLDEIKVSTFCKGTIAPDKINRSGLVTAGEWNDLNNWQKWSELLKKDEYKNMNKYWGIYTENRYPVFMTNENNDPISGVSVFLKNHKDSIIWSTITDIHGRAELFDISDNPSKNPDLHYQYENKKYKIALNKKKNEQGTNIKINAKCRSTSKANIAFVVDATGSMGDEIEFLKSDLASVIENVETRNTNVAISYGGVFYQDKGDTYLTKAQDFTTDERQLISFIDNQSAGGGGDFPEAVDSALIHALSLSWQADAEVKLIFLILDAPPHFEQIERYKKAVVNAAKMGIKIIPITASGINRETDFLMKFTSILTNGTYAFITDHSGVGGEHLAPVHHDYDVEKLNELLVRIINGYIYSTSCEQNIVAHKEDDVVIYPNPAKDVINVKLANAILKDVDVLSSTGQKLISINGSNINKVRINIQDLISGQYYVRLTYDDKVLTKSFIKIE